MALWHGGQDRFVPLDGRVLEVVDAHLDRVVVDLLSS
jgi:hypothetical protein